jgi:hypothetical protein
MRFLSILATIFTLLASSISAGTLSPFPSPSVYFADQGNKIGFSALTIAPNLSAKSVVGESGNITPRHSLKEAYAKLRITEDWDIVLSVGDKWKSDLSYPAGTGFLTSGFQTKSDLVQRQVFVGHGFTEHLTVFGGIRQEKMRTRAAWSAVGYAGGFRGNYNTGVSLGALWENKAIGTFVSLTYDSEIDHQLETRERLGITAFNSHSSMKTPSKLTLRFQVGIHPKVAIIGYASYSDLKDFGLQSPLISNVPILAASQVGSLIEARGSLIEWKIGAGAEISDRWSVAAIFGTENLGGRASIVSPFTGSKSLDLIARYKIESASITIGVSVVEFEAFDIAMPTITTARFNSSVDTALFINLEHEF